MAARTRESAPKGSAGQTNPANRKPTGVTGDPKSILRQRFGLEGFRDGQLAVIERLLSGKNVAAVFPTGGGKSLCYQLPALMLPGTTVVVSPLVALMKDQCDALAAKGIAAARMDSSMTAAEFRDATAGIRDGRIKMLYVAPERFFNERFLASVGQMDVSLFAIDEAHCISQWGHNFRPDYLKLAELAKELDADRVLALTATATPKVLKDIREKFDIDTSDSIRTKFHRPNLSIRSTVVSLKDQFDTLLSRIESRPPGATLVYVTRQQTAVDVAERLSLAGQEADAYHAGLETDVRNDIQKHFLESPHAIVVATIAFGMGIDKSDIRYVYHYNPPKSLESYAQEIGRAGRDGDDAICETILVPDDRIVLENFTYGDTPSKHSVRFLMELLAGQAETFHVSYYRLSSETDIRLTVVKTLLTYLELDGYIKATSPRYDTYKVKPLVTSKVILGHFKGEQRQFLSDLLGCLSKGRKLFLLNVAPAAKKLGCDREKILRAMDHLVEKGWIELVTSDLVYGYRRLRPIDRPKRLADSYSRQLRRRESSEVARMDQVFDLMRAKDCQSARLSKHFGQAMGSACGGCTHCLGEGPNDLPERQTRSIGTSALRMLEEAAERFPDRLVTARSRAKFLCGLSSPNFIRARMTRDPAYGVCDRIPFADVLPQVGGEED